MVERHKLPDRIRSISFENEISRVMKKFVTRLFIYILRHRQELKIEVQTSTYKPGQTNTYTLRPAGHDIPLIKKVFYGHR